MPKEPVRTGHKCFHDVHGPALSDEARFLVRPACACNRKIHACRTHLAKAVTDAAKDCGHMRFGEVVVRPLLPR